ncbi:4-carboxymuconolactone decarboxylase [Sciscionella sp. SE31]|uniref:bifunctional 3-oxoadipate enol-lactonase/4-carboxymuconolactone decarboxylase PcaDC n=1 Tax=Sciscionella sediminilitoris TaxID=1445613 RepID=UPI0004DF9A88
MSEPELSAIRFGDPELPLLVLGPSLGTSALALWGPCAEQLASRFHVLAWDLPGHGRSAPATGFTVENLADAVLELAGDREFAYAGDSIGGAVGLALLLRAPDRITRATLLCTGARIGEPGAWRERAEHVRAHGTASMVEGSLARWFAPGFAARHPFITENLLDSLRGTDSASYAATCEALAGFDVRDRLAEIRTPVLAVAGAHDVPTPVASLAEIADAVADGELVTLPDAAHLIPAEAPAATAALIRGERDGMSVRRAVLGDRHVDRSIAATTEFTAEFQDLITRYAWGEIWTRPGLERRDRSLITLTAMIALGHHEEFAMHVRAARRNGVTIAEIKEVLLQSAIYCGVPAANTAFRLAAPILTEPEEH